MLRTGNGGGSHAGPDSNALERLPWIKANAVMPEIGATDAEIVVVADADVWTEGLTEAVRAVHEGAPWAIPHRPVHRLSEEGTAAVLRGEPWQGQALAEPQRQGIFGGGIVVARRETLLDVPLDPRFVGWGQEDQSWALAFSTLAGRPWRGNADLIHLWHPPPARLSRRWGSMEGRKLHRRYGMARGNPEAMRKLIEEGNR